MNRIDRLLGIITLLQSKKYITAEKIAHRFDISVRTVYRDIKAIAEQGIPVSFEQGRGYFLVQGYFLPPVSFSNEEANSLILMQSVVERFADQSTLKYYTAALEKVKSVLRPAQKERAAFLQEQIGFQTCHTITPEVNFISDIQLAITSATVLEFSYQNKKGISTQRKAEPIGLVFYAYNWHLIAWCYQHKEYRDFRVSSIQQLRSTGENFTKTDHILLKDYMKKLPVNY